MPDEKPKSDAEWRDRLSGEAFRVLRKKGTERPFSHPGFAPDAVRFHCAGCGALLFDKSAKFESGSGWPSFTAPVDPGAVIEETDRSYGMRRTEILCAACNGHLGHVFPDGPEPTGLRYCINGVALEGRPAEPEQEER